MASWIDYSGIQVRYDEIRGGWETRVAGRVLSQLSLTEADAVVAGHRVSPWGLRGDTWIRHMAQTHNMITPYEPELIESNERGAIISYGQSSYGYDIRVANVFKLYHNLRGGVIDPKRTRSDSYIDVEAEFIEIPANSFALGRSVEYIRMPRNVLSLLIGKSTYARCFSTDTQVALANGTSMSIEDMAERPGPYYGYGVDRTGRIIVTHFENPRWTGKNTLVKVFLDNGQSVKCTPDHKFLLRSGDWIEAENLGENDSLMPLYRGVYRGYEGVYQPGEGRMYPTHRLADEWNIRNSIYTSGDNEHRHHKDGGKLNNYPSNIERVNASDHTRFHNELIYGQDFDGIAHSQKIKDALNELRQDDQWYAQYRELQSLRAMSFWNDDQYAEKREALSRLRKLLWANPDRREAQRQRVIRFYQDNPQVLKDISDRSKLYWAKAGQDRRIQQSQIARKNFTRHHFTPDDLALALNNTGSIRGAARQLGCDRSVFRRKELKKVINAWKTPSNHKVVSVKGLDGLHDTFCLTAPETGNFSLEAGVFPSNCGLLLNFTPLEPAWEGFVTIEISNTMPLPVRVYANEGIAQALFFQSPDRCEVSYGDREGKYHRASDLELPKVR